MFLVLINHYGKFMPDLSTRLAPVYFLLRKDVQWKWTSDCEEAFQDCKKCLTNDNLLVHYDVNKLLHLACDATPFRLGCVISHNMPNGDEQPVAFASRTPTPTEKNYAQIDRESLGITYDVESFHKFLYMRKCNQITDNKPLSTIFGPKTAIPALSAPRLQRSALILMVYQYSVQYMRSEDHTNADVLSRLLVAGCILATELQVNYLCLCSGYISFRLLLQ